MGYNNCIPAWMLDEIIKEQKAQRKKWRDMGLTLRARIITGDAEYVKELTLDHMRTKNYKLTTETMAQLESEQYILSQSFVRVKPAGSTVHAPGCACGFCRMGDTKA